MEAWIVVVRCVFGLASLASFLVMLANPADQGMAAVVEMAPFILVLCVLGLVSEEIILGLWKR